MASPFLHITDFSVSRRFPFMCYIEDLAKRNLLITFADILVITRFLNEFFFISLWVVPAPNFRVSSSIRQHAQKFHGVWQCGS